MKKLIAAITVSFMMLNEKIDSSNHGEFHDAEFDDRMRSRKKL